MLSVTPNANNVAAQNTAPTPDAKTSAAGQDAKTAASAGDSKTVVAAQGAKIAAPTQTAKVATSAQTTKSSAAGKQTSNSNAPITNVDNADATTNQTLNGGAAPQEQARADGDSMTPAQGGRSATTHIDALAATPASETGGTPATQSG